MTPFPYHENLHSTPVRIMNRNYSKSQITPSTTYSNLICLTMNDEVSYFMKTHNPDVACITETWLQGSIDESCLYIGACNLAVTVV